MNLDFLTPELFNILVVANLIIGVLLVGWRFYRDMQYQPPEPSQRRSQTAAFETANEGDTQPTTRNQSKQAHDQ